MIAALYIDPCGPYPSISGVECWDAERDARNYAGPWPVVAHPPCGPWGSLRHLYKGDHHDCAIRAVEQVRRWGGVLEHPKTSRLWQVCGLPYPGQAPDQHGGWTIEVCQCDWGHLARKRTYLYMVSVDPDVVAVGPAPRQPTHWTSGTYTSGRRGTVPPGIKVVPPRLRHITPPEFAAWLVGLAGTVAVRSMFGLPANAGEDET